MVNSIAKILGEGGLPKEMVDSLQEAFDKKVAEARSEAELSIREEFARRYEHDKETLVEAMDRMLTDVIQKHEDEKTVAVKEFASARAKYRRAVRENRAVYRSKLNEGLTASRSLVKEALVKEVAKLREQRKALAKDRLILGEKLHAMKESLARQHAERITKIDRFVVKQVERELREFQEDHRLLVASRVKLVAEGRKRLRDTQARFVAEAAKKLDVTITESLKTEMRQLHEDLERNRQNMFGRKVFEAIAGEYLGSFLNEGTEINKLQKSLAAVDAELKATKGKLSEAMSSSETHARKARLAEDRAARSKIMGELLGTLRGEKRTVMEGMLETVKTDALRATFNKMLPVVLDETMRRPAEQGAKKVLSETSRSPARPATVVTGDKRPERRAEVNTDNFNDAEIAQVLKLAGIAK